MARAESVAKLAAWMIPGRASFCLTRITRIDRGNGEVLDRLFEDEDYRRPSYQVKQASRLLRVRLRKKLALIRNPKCSRKV